MLLGCGCDTFCCVCGRCCTAEPQSEGIKQRLAQYRSGLALLAQAMQETGLCIHGFRIEDSAFALAALARLRANNPGDPHSCNPTGRAISSTVSR